MQNSSSILSPKILSALEKLKTNTRRSYLGLKQGTHISPKKGHGLEFSDYREYLPGDNPRSIDWGIYGRSDKIVIKRFHEEENVQILILLDDSQSMRCDNNFWLSSLQLLEAVAFSGLINGEKVIVGTFNGINKEVIAIDNHSGLQRLRVWLNNIKIASKNSSTEINTLDNLLAKAKVPGACIVISDFLIEIPSFKNLCARLRSKNLDTVLINCMHTLPETENTTWIDSETLAELPVTSITEAKEVYKQTIEAHKINLKEASNFKFISHSLPYKNESEILQTINKTEIFTS